MNTTVVTRQHQHLRAQAAAAPVHDQLTPGRGESECRVVEDEPGADANRKSSDWRTETSSAKRSEPATTAKPAATSTGLLTGRNAMACTPESEAAANDTFRILPAF